VVGDSEPSPSNGPEEEALKKLYREAEFGEFQAQLAEPSKPGASAFAPFIGHRGNSRTIFIGVPPVWTPS
jgi:hypothetical protein